MNLRCELFYKNIMVWTVNFVKPCEPLCLKYPVVFWFLKWGSLKTTLAVGHPPETLERASQLFRGKPLSLVARCRVHSQGCCRIFLRSGLRRFAHAQKDCALDCELFRQFRANYTCYGNSGGFMPVPCRSIAVSTAMPPGSTPGTYPIPHSS